MAWQARLPAKITKLRNLMITAGPCLPAHPAIPAGRIRPAAPGTISRPRTGAGPRSCSRQLGAADRVEGRAEAGWGLLAKYRLSVYNRGMTKTRQAMQEPTFLILTALAEGAQHGYGIMTDVARISQGRVRLRAGTLYAALDRLLGSGSVSVDREEIVGGRLRRYYRLTPSGAELLAAEAARLRANAKLAITRLRRLPGSALLAGGAA
jgi:DNA-binding PadR family transcriptional regulator